MKIKRKKIKIAIIKIDFLRYYCDKKDLPMTDIYTYFYTINTSAKDKTEEYLLNINEIADYDNSLNFLPDISPSKCVIKKIMELA